ncbi:hypothetical protein ACFXTH_025005 [Malus domestica]
MKAPGLEEGDEFMGEAEEMSKVGDTGRCMTRPTNRGEQQISRDSIATFGKLMHNHGVIDEHLSRRNIHDLNEVAHDEDIIDTSLAIMPFVDSNAVITSQRELGNDLVDEQVSIVVYWAYSNGMSHWYGAAKNTTINSEQVE